MKFTHLCFLCAFFLFFFCCCCFLLLLLLLFALFLFLVCELNTSSKTQSSVLGTRVTKVGHTESLYACLVGLPKRCNEHISVGGVSGYIHQG